MDENIEDEHAIRRCLIKWINCTVSKEEIHSLADLATEEDNRTISEVLFMIDQDAEKEIVQAQSESHDVEQVFTNIISYLSGFNHQQLYHVVDVRKIATENDEHELAKLVTILLYSAVQCNNCQSFIQSITTLDTKTQHWIKYLIECVMNKLGPDGEGLSAACLSEICTAKKTETLLKSPVPGQPRSLALTHNDSVFLDSPIISLMSSPQMKVKHNQYSQSLALEKLHQKNSRLQRNLEELRHLQSENELDITEKNRQIDMQNATISELRSQVAVLNQVEEENETMKHFKSDYEKLQKECERLKQKAQNLEDFKSQCEDFRELSTKFYEDRDQFEKERENVEQMKCQFVKCKEQNHQLEFKLNELQAALVRRDTIITDLRKEKYEALQAASQSRELLKELNGDTSSSSSDLCSEGKVSDAEVVFPPNIEAQVIELKFENRRLREKVAEVDRAEYLEIKDKIERLLESKKAYEEQYVEIKSQLLELQDTLSYKESQLKQREEAFAKQLEISQEALKLSQQKLEDRNKDIYRLQSELESLSNENKAHIAAAENRRAATAKEIKILEQGLLSQIKEAENNFVKERDHINLEHAQALRERDNLCEKLEKKCTEMKSEIEKLESEVNTLKCEYEVVVNEVDKITREKEKADEVYAKEVHRLNEVVIERDVRVYKIEQCKQEQEKLFNKLKNDNKNLVQKIEDAVRKRESECCELHQTIQELTSQIKLGTEEREQVKDAYENLLADVRKELETEVENRKVISTEFQTARNSWRDLEQQKNQELQTVLQEIEVLKDEFNTRETKLSNEKSRELQTLNDQLDKMSEEMTKNREEMQVKINTLEKDNYEKNTSLQEFNHSCLQLKSELTALEEKLLHTTKSKNLIEEEFQSEKKRFEVETARLTSQISEVTKVFEETREEHLKEKRKTQEQKDKICSLVTLNAELQANADQLVDQLKKVEHALKKLSKKHDDLTHSLERKEIELANELNEKQNLKESIEQLSFQTNELKRSHVSATQEMVSSQQEERKTHAQKIEELEKQLEKTCHNLQAAMHDISSLHDEKRDLQKDIMELRSEKTSLLDCLETEREAANKKITNTLEETSRDIAKLQKSFDTELTSWRKKNEAVKQENVNVRAELCEIKKENVAKLLELRKDKRESEEKMEEDARKLREDLQSYHLKLEKANETIIQCELKLKEANEKERDFNELQKTYTLLKSKCEELEEGTLSLKQGFEKEIEQWQHQVEQLKKEMRELEETKNEDISKLEKGAIEREVKMSIEIEELKQKLEENARPMEQLQDALKASEEFRAEVVVKEEALLQNVESKEAQLKEYVSYVEEKSKLVENLEEMCTKERDENEILKENLKVLEESLEQEKAISRRQGTEVRSLDAQLRHANDQIRQLKSQPEQIKVVRVEQPTETCLYDDSLEDLDDTTVGVLELQDLDSSAKKESLHCNSLDKSTRSLASMRSNESGVMTRSAAVARRQSMIYLKGSTPPENRTTNSGPYFIVGSHMDLGEEDDGPECNWQRIKELNRRNQSQKMPHLRTSYPVEMTQVPPVSTVSEERLRSGRVALKSPTVDKLSTTRKRKSPLNKERNNGDDLSKSLTISRSDSCIGVQEKRSRTSRLTNRFSSTFSSFRAPKSKSTDNISKSFATIKDSKNVMLQEADSSIDPRRESVAFSIEVTPDKPKKKVNRRRTITRSTATTQLVQENHRQSFKDDLKKKPKISGVGQRYPLRTKQANK